MSTEPAVIVGGGHNGLVAACYLARAGRRVVVLEAARQGRRWLPYRRDDPGLPVAYRALMHRAVPLVKTAVTGLESGSAPRRGC